MSLGKELKLAKTLQEVRELLSKASTALAAADESSKDAFMEPLLRNVAATWLPMFTVEERKQFDSFFSAPMPATSVLLALASALSWSTPSLLPTVIELLDRFRAGVRLCRACAEPSFVCRGTCKRTFARAAATIATIAAIA